MPPFLTPGSRGQGEWPKSWRDAKGHRDFDGWLTAGQGMMPIYLLLLIESAKSALRAK